MRAICRTRSLASHSSLVAHTAPASLEGQPFLAARASGGLPCSRPNLEQLHITWSQMGRSLPPQCGQPKSRCPPL
eukprot:13031069-Alexandrium_andersonii.AAC.1